MSENLPPIRSPVGLTNVSLPDELLAAAPKLLDGAPTQAAVRRSVSTAYYALFHLLIQEACANWARSEHRVQLGRAFEHKQMNAASERYRAKCKNAPVNSVEEHLFEVADHFVALQQKRELADYDSSIELTAKQAMQTIREAEDAFRRWEIIRKEPIAQDYLVSLLFKEKPTRSPEWGDR